MPANIADDSGFAPPISKSRFNPGTTAAVAQGLQFYLKNAAGEFLHFSGEGVTTERIYRWHGTAEQAKKLRQAHPFAKAFRTLVSTT